MGRNLLLISYTVVLEFVRKKDFYVILILGFLFVLGVGTARTIGIESEESAKFLMNLGLSLSYLLAAILAVTMACRQIPAELENRTLLPMLARPVSRGEILAGKVLAVAALASATLVLLIAITYLPAPKSEGQRFAVLLQVVSLQLVALLLLTMLTVALSIVCSPPATVVVSLSLFMLGGPILSSVSRAIERRGTPWERLSEHILAVVPDFSLLDHVQRFVEGQPAIEFVPLAAMAGYGLGLTLLLFLFAAWLFNRKTI